MNSSTLFTPKMVRWLSKNVPGARYKTLTPLFNEKFNTSFTDMQMRSVCHYHGIKTGFVGNVQCPVGTEKYIYSTNSIHVKVSMKTKKSGFCLPGTWKAKHVLIWEAAHGKIPKGFFVVFADGNKNNFDIGNLLLVSHRELVCMGINKMFSNNPEITKTNLVIIKHRLAILDAIERRKRFGRGK